MCEMRVVRRGIYREKGRVNSVGMGGFWEGNGLNLKVVVGGVL